MYVLLENYYLEMPIIQLYIKRNIISLNIYVSR